ncbi:phosphate ABC transporter substrate-binding protein [Methanobacterium ferruginis]|uniref:phosphate ABC transporter substrate-binding protein n=1 Tax=Methanobacterium ferruginis TaxID=710191 RepID=UPI0025744304|nr:phosphate ABC transporter substrate-binding protein [Methanobacterium ferruginis]BDZ66640.1 phosphate-binding protein [Methanobacterium ferruginis]
MDMKYIIGIIVALIVIVGAYLVLAGSGSGQEETITIVGSTSVQPVAEQLATEYMKSHPNVKVTVQGGGSSVGIKSAQDGTANIGTSSKNLKANESEGLTQWQIGLDGIAIVVNNENNLTGLTMDQVKGIFTGEITNWKEVGGPDAEINVVIREEGSGTRDAVQEIVLGKDSSGNKVAFVSDAIVQSSTEAVQQAVAQDPNAIGFISFASVSDTKALQIDGVTPSEDTVLDGTYKIQRPFLFLVKGDLTGAVKEFVDWVNGSDGQAIIKSEKVVPTGVEVNSTS